MNKGTLPGLPGARDPSRAFAEAASLHQQGRLFEAATRYQAILASDPRHFEAAYRLGMVHLQRGALDEAERAFLAALKIDRKSPHAHHHLAMAQAGLDRHQDAIKSYRKALTFRPGYPEAHASLGFSLQTLGKFEDAISHFRTALRLSPEFTPARNGLGIALQAKGDLDSAAAELQKAIDLSPDYPDSYRNLANVRAVQERFGEALTHYAKALSIRPDDRDAKIGMANALSRLGRLDDVIAVYEEMLRKAPEDTETRIGLGDTFLKAARPEQALDQFARVIASHPKELKAYLALGAAHLAMGNEKEATDAFEQAVSLSPRAAGPLRNLATARRFLPGDRHIATMMSLAEDIDALDPQEQIELHFALGKVLADIGEHARSFQHVLQGNAIMRARISYDEVATLQHHARIKDVFSADLMRAKSGSGCQSPVPIFVVGMPRSGTTLIEQILASHPQVHGAGELPDLSAVANPGESRFPDWVAASSGPELAAIGEAYVRRITPRAPSAGRIVDKMPGNFALAGLIHLALPNAKIIHARRDLRDVAFSCFSILFGTGQYFTYDLAELGRYAKSYEGLMAHWAEVLPEGAMLDVGYEDLVADLESHARRIVSYCGLEWDDACLSFYKTQRSVLTASMTQVRQPIYHSSIGRWRPHEAMLGPLLEALKGNMPR
jgi:pentatricopeptide repeat protein